LNDGERVQGAKGSWLYWCGECALNRRGRQSDNCLMAHIGAEGATSIGMAPTHDDDVVRTFIERMARGEVDPTNANNLYVGSDQGIYKSTNGAVSWAPSNNGLNTAFSIRSVRIAPNNPSVIYAASQGAGVFKSTDGGATWNAANYALVCALAGQRGGACKTVEGRGFRGFGFRAPGKGGSD
jgi:hypothetical protein